MRRMLKFVEVAWIVIAIISLLELVRLWGTYDTKFWIFLGCMVMAVFMFFFRRKQRVRYEENLKNKENQ